MVNTFVLCKITPFSRKLGLIAVAAWANVPVSLRHAGYWQLALRIGRTNLPRAPALRASLSTAFGCRRKSLGAGFGSS